MNEQHARLCASPEWQEHLRRDVLPWLFDQVTLGATMLEVGPGPGGATDLLRHEVDTLHAIEQDPEAAAKLTARFPGGNVRVTQGDATDLPFAADTFDSAGSFTMLHHLPTAALQNRMLAELLRVLRPGCPLIASDSLPSDGLHHFHQDDTYNPVEPATLLTRLQTIGYEAITLRVYDRLSFIAHKPSS